MTIGQQRSHFVNLFCGNLTIKFVFGMLGLASRRHLLTCTFHNALPMKTHNGNKFLVSHHFTMKHKYLLAILAILFVHRLVFQLEAYPLLLQKKVVAEKFDWTRFIEYRYEQECLQIVIDTEQQPELSLTATNTPVYVRSHSSLKSRDISTEAEGQCETFLIFAESIEMVNKIFQFNRTFVKRFFPFTNIYLYLENRHSYTTNAEALFSIRQFLINNAVFGYMFEYNYNENESKVVVIRDLLRNDVKRERVTHIPKELSHPMVDTKIVKDDFRISLFNCTPYTIYPQLENRDDALVVSLFL